MLDQDDVTNTNHAQFRQYSSNQGHWLSPDPDSGSYEIGKHMKTIAKWITGLGICLFICGVSIHVYPEFVLSLFYLILLVGMMLLLALALIKGPFEWRRFSRFWFMPMLICFSLIFCSYYFASTLGRHISDAMLSKHLEEYAAVVANFRVGNAFCASSCDGEDVLLRGLTPPTNILDVRGAHCDGNSVVVLFRLTTDVPLLSEGYMFRDYEEGGHCSKRFGSPRSTGSRFPYVRHIEGNWYHFSSQPGF